MDKLTCAKLKDESIGKFYCAWIKVEVKGYRKILGLCVANFIIKFCKDKQKEKLHDKVFTFLAKKRGTLVFSDQDVFIDLRHNGEIISKNQVARLMALDKALPGYCTQGKGYYFILRDGIPYMQIICEDALICCIKGRKFTD